jgi:WD40 repeat protein
MVNDIIDFRSERGRHETLLGRDDVMAELDALLWGGPSRGWVLVKGGPGMGKSALLSGWLKRCEDAGRRVPPHHFLRRGVEDWDRPEVVKRNLAAQVEALHPELVDLEARPESRLRELLQRVADKVLVPSQEQLVLVVDGLDEAEADVEGANPLPGFLPHTLPPNVKVLCASRPTHPHLSWLEAREGVRTIDLDDERWASSNRRVVREYWERERLSPRFKPPLTTAFVDEVVQRAEGNVLYSVKLAEWLESQPAGKRRAELLPRGLEALLDESWERIQRLPVELRRVAEEGLGVVAVAREALPKSLLSEVAGWRELGDAERFLKVARSFLLEEVGHWSREKAWRPFHEFFRNFILSKLGAERQRALHLRLAEQLCTWPMAAQEKSFRWNYALRHGLTHWLGAEQWAQARGLYTDLGYLQKKCEVAGVLSVEEALKSAAVEAPEKEREMVRALHRAIQTGSHFLRTDTKALPMHLYNWLRSSGWTAEQLEKTLTFPEGLPVLRLLHPVNPGVNERTLEGHTHWVTACAVFADGRRVVSASDDGTLKVWEVETGRELATLQGHAGWVRGCAVTPDGRRVVSASYDQTLKVWDVETGRELAMLEGHAGRVRGCAVTPDGRRIVSASEDETLRVWEVETGRLVATLRGHGGLHGGAVNGCAVFPDGRYVVSASRDRTLKIWELKTGDVMLTLKGHGAAVLSCVVSPDGRHVVSGSADKTLRVWDVETGQQLATLEGHGDWVQGCVVTPDGRHCVSASSDKTLKLWDLESGKQLATLEGHGGTLWGCAITADGRRVLSASSDKTLKVWDLEIGRQAATLEGHRGRVRGCAVSPDGRRVVSASDDKTLKVWDVKTGRPVATLEGHTQWVRGCAVTPDGRRVVSASDDGTVKVWVAETGRPVATLEGHGKWPAYACAVTPEGRYVISASEDKTLKVWEVETGRWVTTLKGHGGAVLDCVVLPDGRRVVSVSADGTLKVWEVETGRQIATLEGHEGWVHGCAVTPDGRRVLSASTDWKLKVWEVETGRQLTTLEGHGGWIRDCAVFPDGRRGVSASDDKTLKIWDLDSGRCLHTLHGFTAFFSVDVGPELLCAGDALGNVWMLEVAPCAMEERGSPPREPLPSPRMNFTFPLPLLEALRSRRLALSVGSGLSLGRDVQGGFPTWAQLPQRLLEACERLGVLDEQVLQAKRSLFKSRQRLEVMLAELGALCTALGRDYQNALNAIFRPADAAPGKVHEEIGRLAVEAILTTNYDPLIEELREKPRRHIYTWKEAALALNDLKSGRHVLLKIHGTAERHDTVVMTEREYDRARSDQSYQAVLRHLLQEYTILFLGYGMNDPLDLDLVLKWNTEAFKAAARRHYVMLKDPSDADRDRYEREFNVQVIPYRDHEELPAILRELQNAGAR